MNERKTRIEVTLADRLVGLSVREWRVGKPKGQVICLHGLGVSGAQYAPMAAGLNEAGFDVLAPDWIGHGDSGYLDKPGDYDWSAYVKCLTAIVQRHHGPMTHYVGTSWGGAILLMFLLSLRLRPQSAIFVDVPIRDAEETARHLRILEAQVGKTFSSIAEGNAFLTPMRPYFLRVPQPYQAYLDGERYRPVGDRFGFRFDPAILPKAIESTRLKYNRFRELRRFHFDAFFAYGATSPHCWPAAYIAVADKSPRLHYDGNMSGAHPPMLLFEEQFGPIIDFIKRMNPSP